MERSRSGLLAKDHYRWKNDYQNKIFEYLYKTKTFNYHLSP